MYCVLFRLMLSVLSVETCCFLHCRQCRVVLLCVVYNWTVDNVVSWLSDHVELGQYVPNFKANSIEGRALPRYVLVVFVTFAS